MTFNAAIIDTGSAVVLEANGVAMVNNAIARANDASYSIFTHGGARPNGRFVLSWAQATAPTEGAVISLLARPLNISGTNDAEAPETTRAVWLGDFVVNNVTTTQYAELYVDKLPWEADYYLYNNGTGQTISAGWTLSVDPYTLAPATA